MKILITGSQGMLAKAVINNLKDDNELICTNAQELDITNKQKVKEYVEKIKPDYIINCAAYTAVDKAEEEQKLARQVNAQGTKNLAIVAKEQDTVLIHISTDYVFNGDLNIKKEYKEEDKTDPVTIYGKTKQEGEKYIKENMQKYYILRTAWLYGDGNNFVRTMLNLAKDREQINVVNDQYGSPTYTEDLAFIIKQIIKSKIPYGIYHTTNIGFTNWYEFTKKIFEMCGIKCKINPVTSEEFIRPAKRPKNSKLSKDKILKEGIIIPNWEEGLKKYLISEKKIKV